MENDKGHQAARSSIYRRGNFPKEFYWLKLNFALGPDVGGNYAKTKNREIPMKLKGLIYFLTVTSIFAQGNFLERDSQAFFWVGSVGGSLNGVSYGPTYGYTFRGVFDVSGSVIKTHILDDYSGVNANSGNISGVFRPFEENQNTPVKLEMKLGHSRISVIDRSYIGEQRAFTFGIGVYGKKKQNSYTKIIPSVSGNFSYVNSKLSSTYTQYKNIYIVNLIGSLSLARKISERYLIFVIPQIGVDPEGFLLGINIGYLKLK